jgi:hypothetical protein
LDEKTPNELLRPPAIGFPFWAFAVCAAAVTALLWSVEYLPLVDLPQHVAQLAYWIHYDDPAFGFAEQFRFVVSPYFVGIGLARVAALALPLAAAMKLVITLAVIALPWSIARLLRHVGVDRWWALLGFPLALGFSFQWGFFAWNVALPLFLLALPSTLSYARRPTVRGGAVVGLAGVVLFWAHGLMLVLFLAVAGAAVAVAVRPRRRALVALLPLLVPLGLAVSWRLSIPRAETDLGILSHARPWALAWLRPIEWLSLSLSAGFNPMATAFGCAMVALLLAAGLRPSRERLRWVPFAVAAACYALMPWAAVNVAYLNQRFAVFLIPLALVGFDAGPRRVPARWLQVATLALVLGVIGHNAVRFHRFDAEARGFKQIVAATGPAPRLLYLPFDAGVPGFETLPFLHFSAYIQAERGGTINFSGASTAGTVIQYRAGRAPGTRYRLHQQPQLFDWRVDGDHDHFLVRTSAPDPRELFPAEVPLRLAAHVGRWWLFRKQ